MNSEISNFEINSEQSELNSEQKRALCDLWTKMIVDNTEVPENIEIMSHEEIKKWLFESIMNDIERFTEELGIQIDIDLVEKIKKEEDMDKKSALELEYINKVHAEVDKIVQKFVESGEKSTTWDSWPKRMRETKEFNCVGATLLGINLLEKGGIKSYYGRPHEHVVNIAKLANGEWWYVDFRNGKQNIIKIEPDETKIADVSVLEVKQSNIDFGLIPIFDNSEAAGSMLDNLDSLKNCVENENIPNDDIEKKEAKEYLKKYDQNFQKVDFSLLRQSLYPKFVEIEKTEEIKHEADKINKMGDFEKPVNDYLKTLTKEQIKIIIQETKIKAESIKNLFYQEDKSILHEASPEMKKVLELFLESLKEVKNEQSEVYRRSVDKFIGKINNL